MSIHKGKVAIDHTELMHVIVQALGRSTSRCLDDEDDFSAVVHEIYTATHDLFYPPKPGALKGGKLIPFRRRRNPAPSYEASHWGEQGKGRGSMIDIPDPHDGPLVVLGEKVKTIVYETIKGGDSGPTEYEHKFESPHPKLIYNGSGKLLFGDGGYTVTERGIVR